MAKITDKKLELKTNRNFNQLTGEIRQNLERMGVGGLTIDIRWDTKANISIVRFNYKGKNYEMRANNQKNVLFNTYALCRRIEWKARMHLLGIEDFDISVSPYLMIEGYTTDIQEPEKASAKAYAILGLSEISSNDEIEKQYKKLAKSFHPDMALSAEAKVEFQRRFSEINSAYTEIKKERGIK